MADDLEVRGSQQLAALGVRLKATGDGALKRQMLAVIRAAASETIPDIRQQADEILPHGGGLAEQVASAAYGVRIGLAASGGRVSIIGRGMKELRDIDQGNLRHPVFGNREVWRAQSVTEGFVSTPANARTPKTRAEIVLAMRKTAEEIGRGL